MTFERADLEKLDRDMLIAKAEALGVARAQVLTRPELIDELLLRTGRAGEDSQGRRSRGLFGRARDLLARVVERGLHLPDAADRLRTVASGPVTPPQRVAPNAVPTVTLAEIYAAQGHKARAMETLERVLLAEPEHVAAKQLLEQLRRASVAPPPPAPKPHANGARTSAGSPEGPATSTPPAAPPSAASAPGGAEGAGANGGGGDRGGSDDAKKPAPPAEPMGMLDDAPLPPKYDVDECVMIPVDPETMFVYWEVRDVTRAHLEASRPGGALALRVLVILPTWDGPRTYTQDFEVYGALGEYFVRELPRGCVARAALGWKVGGVFTAIAHSPPLEAHPAEPWPEIAHGAMHWTPTGARPLEPGEDAGGLFGRVPRLPEGAEPAIDAMAFPRAAERAHGADGGVPSVVFDQPLFAEPPLGSSERRAFGGPGGAGPGGRGVGSSERMLGSSDRMR